MGSGDGHCRTFDAEARGTVFGDGCGIVVLKRLADAIADGDCIRAVIKGAAINNDGSGKVELHRAERGRPGRGHRRGAGAGRRRAARASATSRRTAPRRRSAIPSRLPR